MTETRWMNREIQCRCGRAGVITGVQGADDRPELVWVNHMVGMSEQTHIHRSAQMPAVLAQLTR